MTQQKSRMLPTLLGILTAIFILAICALLFMDNIMRAVAPEVYLLGRASRTYNTISEEIVDVNSRKSLFNLIRDHHGIEFNGQINDINAQLNEEYDKSIPLSYITGKILGIDIELLLKNDTCSVCLPSISQTRYTIPSQSFGAILNASPLAPFMPIQISNSASVTLPKQLEQIDSYGIYAALEDLLRSAKIDKRSTKTNNYLKYNLYIKGADLKQTLINICPSIFGAQSELNELCTNMLQNAAFPENAVIQIGERDKQIVYLSTEPTISEQPFKLSIDLSGATDMLNDIKFEISYAGFGVKLSSSGAHTRGTGTNNRVREPYSDESELSITTPFTENLYISSYVHPLDNNNFSSRTKLQSDFGSAVIEAQAHTDGNSISYDIKDLNIFDKYKATGTFVITSKSSSADPIMIKERIEKPLSELKSLRDLF